MSNYTANPFDLLGDEGDERPRRQTPKQPAPAAKPATQPSTAAAPKTQQPAPAQQKPAAAKAPATSAPAAKKDDVKPKPQGDAQKGNNDKKAPAQQQQSRPHQQGGAPRNQESNFESEKPPRPAKDRRDYPARDRPPASRGRQFDRKSGTGRSANENIKSGSGKGNWGNIAEDVETVATETAAPKERAEGEKEGEVAEPAAAEPAAEPEKELLSLDEYYETLKSKAVKNVEAPKLREAGEGVDQSAWAEYAPLKKDDEVDAPKKKKAAAPKKEPAATNGKGEEKIAIDKIFKVSMPPPQGIEERRGDRGDRRGGRGGKGGPNKGGQRRPNQFRGEQAAKPEKTFSIEADFPALGGSGGASHPASSSPTQTPASQQTASPSAVKA